FATPINSVKEILPELRSRGKVTRAWAGIAIQEMNAALAETLGVKNPGGARRGEARRRDHGVRRPRRRRRARSADLDRAHAARQTGAAQNSARSAGNGRAGDRGRAAPGPAAGEAELLSAIDAIETRGPRRGSLVGICRRARIF